MIGSRLKRPSEEFFMKLEKMESCFNVSHGETSLKQGHQSVRNLSFYISSMIDLPADVVTFFVKCRTYFRIRELNKKNERPEGTIL